MEDVLGQKISVGDYVVAPKSRACIEIGKVVEITKRMIRFESRKHGAVSTRLLSPNSVVRLGAEDAMHLVLKGKIL